MRTPASRPVAPARPAGARTAVQYAKGFRIDYSDKYKVITFQNPLEPKAPAVRYLLVPRGAARPAGYPGAQPITTPIRSLVGLLALHMTLADFLGITDVLTGLGSFKYVAPPRVRQRIAASRLYEVDLNSNNYRESGTVHPNFVPADLVKILPPEFLSIRALRHH